MFTFMVPVPFLGRFVDWGSRCLCLLSLRPIRTSRLLLAGWRRVLGRVGFFWLGAAVVQKGKDVIVDAVFVALVTEWLFQLNSVAGKCC